MSISDREPGQDYRYEHRDRAVADREWAIGEGAIVGPLQFDVTTGEYLYTHLGWKGDRHVDQ